MATYMINGCGPFVGAEDLDFISLAEQCRLELYAKAEAEGCDWCWPGESDFQNWLLENGHLVLMACTEVSVQIDVSGDKAYMPKHWPACPECHDGRGSDEFDMETVMHSLNRVTSRFICQKCDHEWGHREVPWRSDAPMLEDDGRCVDGGCVPYTISQVCGFSFDRVLHLCSQRGWRKGTGMNEIEAITMLTDLGVSVASQATWRFGYGNAFTLGRFLDCAEPDKRYIVSTGDHWLAVVDGQNLDQSGTHKRRLVRSLWEVSVTPDALQAFEALAEDFHG